MNSNFPNLPETAPLFIQGMKTSILIVNFERLKEFNFEIFLLPDFNYNNYLTVFPIQFFNRIL